VTSGKLPKGLRLDRSTGVISGVPSKKAASSTFTVEVLDTKTGKPKTQNTATATFTITVS
jgi:Putative Ig domain